MASQPLALPSGHLLLTPDIITAEFLAYLEFSGIPDPGDDLDFVIITDADRLVRDLDPFVLGLVLLFCVAYPAGYHIGRALARALLPLIAIALVAIVTWFCLAALVLWKAIVFAAGWAWDWFKN